MNVTTQPTRTPAGAAPVGGLPWIEDAGKVAPKDARQLSKLFFDRLRSLEEGTREYSYARNTLIEMNMSLVRFAPAGSAAAAAGSMEDILQVGTIGLIKAIDRFDLSREVEFTTFAVPYIVGEMKRFFRDTSWAVHVPRRLQELRVELAKAQRPPHRRAGPPPTRGGARRVSGARARKRSSRAWSPPTATRRAPSTSRRRRRRVGQRGRPLVRRHHRRLRPRRWNSSRTSTRWPR